MSNEPLFDSPHTGATSCANCLTHALTWRATVTDHRAPVQLGLGL